MPYFAIDHNISRKRICAACGIKDINCNDLETNPTLLELVQEYANEEYSTNYLNQPTCKRCLYIKNKGGKVPTSRQTKF